MTWALGAASALCALVAWEGGAAAQDVLCRSNETKAECHARLQCGEDEELDDCQRRILQCRKGEDLEKCQKRRGGGDEGGGGGGRDDGDGGGGRDDDDGGGGGRDDDDRGGGRDDDGDRGGGGDDGGDSDWRHDRRGDGGGDGGGGGGYAGTRTFGLGLEIGEPTGLTGKYFLSETGALDFGLGWIYRHYYYDDGLHLYVDYLWHPAVLTSTPSIVLPFYIGVGLRYWDFDYCERRDFCYDGSALGIRVPIGVAFELVNAPLDIFIQMVPTLDFLQDDYYERHDDRTHLGIDVSAGIRFWF